jgi:hypothetical protein
VTPFESLRGLYGDDEPTLRATDSGLWHATPLAVLAAAIPVLVETGVLARVKVVFDAGAGDGRLLAALALGLPGSLDLRLLGLECDATLAATAARRLDALRERRPAARLPRVAAGDFFVVSDYAPLETAPSELDVVFNYPDGNERRLLRWLGEQGKRETRLVILSPDHEPALGPPPLIRSEVRTAEAGVAWCLSVYAPS